jgi:hypothetical protein
MSDFKQPKQSKCHVCNRSDRINIDLAIASGDSRRTIAARFGVSEGAAGRHAKHVQKPTTSTETTTETAGVGEIADMKARARDAAARAKAKGDIRAELLAERERRQALELELRLAQTDASGDIVLTNHPAWQLFLRRLLDTVKQCPQCVGAILANVPPGTQIPEVNRS